MSGLLIIPKNVITTHIIPYLLYKDRIKLYSTCKYLWKLYNGEYISIVTTHIHYPYVTYMKRLIQYYMERQYCGAVWYNTNNNSYHYEGDDATRKKLMVFVKHYNVQPPPNKRIKR